MTITELISKLKKKENQGYGNKTIIVQNGEMDLHIDSIQQNNSSNKEPEYYFIMEGDIYESE